VLSFFKTTDIIDVKAEEKFVLIDILPISYHYWKER